MPWDDRQPNPHLTQWAKTAAERGIAGPGRRALVVGCGVGGDPAFLADLGCQVTAFDVSPTAIAEARERFPDEPVDYQVADLLAPPPEWQGTFDLVAEIYTVQALYGPARAAGLLQLPDPLPQRPLVPSRVINRRHILRQQPRSPPRSVVGRPPRRPGRDKGNPHPVHQVRDRLRRR